ncbi:hypothetical protein GCM10009104_09940 [Marinobacterium maritimum]|uniref:Uncharacterized protein n=1 Tax=Marinobacterium maritimum TaxID=500162 RepID=A0ABN1I3L8_9GAMM
MFTWSPAIKSIALKQNGFTSMVTIGDRDADNATDGARSARMGPQVFAVSRGNYLSLKNLFAGFYAGCSTASSLLDWYGQKHTTDGNRTDWNLVRQ